MAKVALLKSKGLRRVDGEWDEACTGVYDGVGEKYLDRFASSKYFKVTLVKPGNKIARVWPASLREPSSGKPPAKWDYGL